MPACGKVPHVPGMGLAFLFAPLARPGGEREGLGKLPPPPSRTVHPGSPGRGEALGARHRARVRILSSWL